MLKPNLQSLILVLLAALLTGPAYGAELIRFTVPVNLQNVPTRVAGLPVNIDGARISCTVRNNSTNTNIGTGANQWSFSGSYRGSRTVAVNVTGPYLAGHRLAYRCELALCARVACTTNGVTANPVTGNIPMKK